MRVLHFFKTYWPDTFGGIERTIHAIAKGAAEHGIASDVLSLSAQPEKNTLSFDGHMAYKAKLDLEFASTGLSRDVFSRFRELSSKADIIHYHFPWPMSDIVQVGLRPDKPTIVTYHSDIVKQKLLLQFYRPLMNRFLGSVDRIVATSPNYVATSEVLQRFTDKTTVIPLGLAEEDYPPAEEASKARWRERFPRPFFLFVGVLRYYKGLRTLLTAARTSNVDIVIVGDGPMKSQLMDYAKKHGLSHVHFAGALPDSDKTALLELSAGLVFPSHLRSEAFGLSLVEASMFGKPMISCEIGTGTSYVNLDGQTGIVIPPQDPGALSKAMQIIANDQALAETFGANARKRYLEYFTADKMTLEYVKNYTSLTR
ncbi:glycosyltransferase involved in cell wall biosynthesis [Ochrobactrum sp. 19YEA23]|uniref:glycosyltransferase family 4 protein n=1 Tax=Ochrobactrum sp. 19YEA23 TaxID=3039854 RepID=UPI0024798339|nr:glycosyltransferase involved in cell wall biosynthesis [Ochrobactrum sp. 19YEA23]